MTERGRNGVQREGERLCIGPSSLRWENDALIIDIDEVGVPLPTRLRGQVRLYPSTINTEDFALDAAGRHRWWPIAPTARVEVDFTNPNLRWSGPGYMDSNRGSEPLEEAFQSWDWSRAELDQGAAVLYDLRPRNGQDSALALRFDKTGRAEAFDPPPRVPLSTTLVWRIDRQTQCEPGQKARVVQTLEDTPFYARSVVETGLFGERALSVHESLCLDRFSSNWVKVLLPFRMPRISG